jgi:hypothetical protein
MAKRTSKPHRVKTEAPRIISSRSPTFSTWSRQAAGTSKYVRAHEEIINKEDWYGDAPPSLGKSFTAKKTAERQYDVVQILGRAAKRAAKAGSSKLAQAYDALADKLDECRPRHRCGSLACPRCARAFQRAKVAAQRRLIKKLAKARPGKKLVMANVIPLWMTYRPDQLAEFDIPKRNRWLKDALAAAGFRRVMLGSADLSWEQGYYQLHWHVGMWTSNRKKLKRRLKAIFPSTGEKLKRRLAIFLSDKKYRRPVVVSNTWSLGFIPYKHKAIKLPDLLRRNRTHLPELFLALDRTEPLELMVLSRLRLSAPCGRLVLRPVVGSGGKSRSKASVTNTPRK